MLALSLLQKDYVHPQVFYSYVPQTRFELNRFSKGKKGDSASQKTLFCVMEKVIH